MNFNAKYRYPIKKSLPKYIPYNIPMNNKIIISITCNEEQSYNGSHHAGIVSVPLATDLLESLGVLVEFAGRFERVEHYEPGEVEVHLAVVAYLEEVLGKVLLGDFVRCGG
jgi:hypothetical protein